MEAININGQLYQYVSNFRDNRILRSHFNTLTQKVYHFDFENWYRNGYWGDRYIPYALLDGEKMVANVSVNLIDFWVLGEKRFYIQIGTVMTHPAYRNKGLSKTLVEKVLENWKGKCDLIYLFANDTVLDFYPKFGFRRAAEFQHSKNITKYTTNVTAQKLDMALDVNRELVIKKIHNHTPVSQISMIGNADLVMFYLTGSMSGDVYYLAVFDAIVIAEYTENTLYLKGIYCEEQIELDALISAMAKEKIQQVVLGFTPKNTASFEEKLHMPEDVLFILDDKYSTFKHAKVLFPVLSHA